MSGVPRVIPLEELRALREDRDAADNPLPLEEALGWARRLHARYNGRDGGDLHTLEPLETGMCADCDHEGQLTLTGQRTVHEERWQLGTRAYCRWHAQARIRVAASATSVGG